MVDAIPALNTEKAVALFEKFGVFTKAELDSRVEIEYETYATVSYTHLTLPTNSRV